MRMFMWIFNMQNLAALIDEPGSNSAHELDCLQNLNQIKTFPSPFARDMRIILQIFDHVHKLARGSR